MLHADPLRGREIKFTYEGEAYRARFTRPTWAIFNDRGIICPEHQMPELWQFFKEHKQPKETKTFGSLGDRIK